MKASDAFLIASCAILAARIAVLTFFLSAFGADFVIAEISEVLKETQQLISIVVV